MMKTWEGFGDHSLTTREIMGKVTKMQEKHHIQESQEVIPLPAGEQKAAINRQDSMTGTHIHVDNKKDQI